MGAVKSCCQKQLEDNVMVTKMDLSHCGCLEVPHVVFNAERCIETLILSSNQITSLPPQLFHCQEMKHLNLNDNCLVSIPPAIGSFLNLVSLKLDKNNLQELPDNLKMCKKLKRLSLNNNPWKQMPNIVTQLISLEELYMNDCELNYCPASVGRLSKLKILELRNNNLCNLPLSMSRLEILTRLDISGNEFTELPACVPKLKSLKELLLDNNDIEEITDMKNLVFLEHLDASCNHIINISETIGHCVNLNLLNLSFNYIEQLPNTIGNITYLQTLQLEMNELTEIPKSIGKLSYLEELNLCNNKLCNLPNTIGLLRNLKNLNVSKNMIEEFPPEIGSCTQLVIIIAAYNRLQVLPSEIGYLNNLKVLDLVGNFLMYLPITITNLRGVRAIWLSANQNVPLIPFTEDLNLASGERFLTNIALPQLGEIPLRNTEFTDKKINNKKIRFAEDEDLLPGKLHRTPTPFPKDVRSPNRKHQRHEEPKPNDNYVNVIDGKVSEQENTQLQPPSKLLIKSSTDLNNSRECLTRIREANIRRNNKDPGSELPFKNYCNENGSIFGQELENEENSNKNESGGVEHSPMTSNVQSKSQNDYNPSPTELYRNTTPPGLHRISEPEETDNLDHNDEQCGPVSDQQSTAGYGQENTQQNFENGYPHHVIYSNINGNKENISYDNSERDKYNMTPQKIREMYHNDVIHGNEKNPKIVKFLKNSSASDYYSVNFEERPPYSIPSCTNDNSPNPPLNSYSENTKRIYSTLPPPPPPPPLPPSQFIQYSSNALTNRHHKATISQSPSDGKEMCSNTPSKQDYILLAEKMRHRNISPPCYEIAKMYSTKAALFENNRIDHLKS